MSTLHVNLIGRFGNQMFQYAYARAIAERDDERLTSNRWVGEQIFELPNHENDDPLRCDVHTLETEYHQDQASLIYTRKQVKEWFTLKGELEHKLCKLSTNDYLYHRRLGDYEKLGYVVVSLKSYYEQAEKLGLDPSKFSLLTEEFPWISIGLPLGLQFMEDFWTMMRCKILFRGNSTFSWWAATLGNAKVYSPVIEGLEGGREQDCKFVEGNWPRFANLPFTTDLHLPE